MLKTGSLRKRWFQVSVIAVLSFSASCSSDNILSEFADNTSDESLYFEAVQALNSQNYTTAVNLITATSSDFQADREVQLVLASAHAGTCGFNFIDFVQAVTATTTDTLFTVLFKTMTNATNDTQSGCTTATTLINGIAAAGSRTDDENILMALVSLATIGIVLNKNADGDQNESVDAAFDYCADISDSDYRELVVAVSNVVQSLSNVSSTIAADDISDINTTCSTLEGAGFTGLCSTTSTGDVSSSMITGMKGLVGSNASVGLGTCSNSVENCAAACP